MGVTPSIPGCRTIPQTRIHFSSTCVMREAGGHCLMAAVTAMMETFLMPVNLHGQAILPLVPGAVIFISGSQ